MKPLGTTSLYFVICNSIHILMFIQDLEDHIDEKHNKPQETDSKDANQSEGTNTLQTTTSDTYTAWPVKKKSEEPVKSPSAKQEETVPNKRGVTPAGKSQVILEVFMITESFMTFPPDVQ